MAVSIRREKVEDPREKEGSQFNYRVAFRTSEVRSCSWSLPHYLVLENLVLMSVIY